MNMLKNLTPLQWIGIVLGINGVLNTYAPQLGGVFHNDNIVIYIQLATGIGSAIVGVIVTSITGQGAQVRNVLAMDGVQHIDVNAKANPTLAKLAVDKNVDKIAPIPSAVATVEATAKTS